MKISWPRILPVVILAVLLGLSFLYRQEIGDWWKMRGYTPPTSIVQLADEDTMNAYTRHLFYLNKPQLLSTVSQFRQYCPENENTIVLGCYHPGQNGIYIYAVQDDSLTGIQQVTAAHEVLHAVYARLSSAARKQLDGELESYYQHDLTDPNVKAEVALYQKTEPNAVYDEMSCTFGTEIAQLPASLNSYYAQFFTDRQRVVAYEQRYEAQFTSREQQIAAYDTQLATMKQQIETRETGLTAENANLIAQEARLQQQLASGQVAGYNTAVSGYNAQVNSYNLALSSLRQQIEEYNQLVGTRKGIAGQLTTLDGAIDTRLNTAAAQ